MSKENFPNLQAVGLIIDIRTALQNRVRGNAKKAGEAKIAALFMDEIRKFVASTNVALDQYFGTEPK